MLTPRSIFGRSVELEQLGKRLATHRSFLLHGPAGVGKTQLLLHVASEFPEVLYSGESLTPQSLYRNLSRPLLAAGHPVLAKACPDGVTSLHAKTAVAVRGLLRDALRGSNYLVIADHLTRPSQALGACVRDLMIDCEVAVIAVARSAHMEDAGFVLPLFPNRTERFALHNFDPEGARVFAARCAETEGLKAGNLPQFLNWVADRGEGNPGAILQMIHLATKPKYSTENRIKIAPLYIDYKLSTLGQQSGGQ